MKTILFFLCIVVMCVSIRPQTWQAFGIPEGSGITDLVYWKGGGAVYGDKLWATTGSVDWPSGQRGGVFYSSTTPPNQEIWFRVGGSAGYYIGRRLAVGQDGRLYASLWRDPLLFPADGLFRFEPQAGIFGLLYQADSSDNIFSIAIKNSPHTIFAGTRNGIIRSTDNGANFNYSNTGIPDSAWVYDIAIDSTGIVAIATSKGVFISEDNGDSWQTTSGIPAEDTVKTLFFVNDSTLNKSQSRSNASEEISFLFAGTNNAELYQSFREQKYLTFLLSYLFSNDGETVDYAIAVLTHADRRFAAIYKTKEEREMSEGGGVYQSSDNGVSWDPVNDGLPSNPPVSALTVKSTNENTSELYAGLFNDTTNGAAVYKLSVVTDIKELKNQIPYHFKLHQNYPNPFNSGTTIQFSIPEESSATLEIFNPLGEKISTLVSENLSAGSYEYEWNAKGLTSGIYFYQLKSSGQASFREVKKMILLK